MYRYCVDIVPGTHLVSLHRVAGLQDHERGRLGEGVLEVQQRVVQLPGLHVIRVEDGVIWGEAEFLFRWISSNLTWVEVLLRGRVAVTAEYDTKESFLQYYLDNLL